MPCWRGGLSDWQIDFGIPHGVAQCCQTGDCLQRETKRTMLPSVRHTFSTSNHCLRGGPADCTVLECPICQLAALDRVRLTSPPLPHLGAACPNKPARHPLMSQARGGGRVARLTGTASFTDPEPPSLNSPSHCLGRCLRLPSTFSRPGRERKPETSTACTGSHKVASHSWGRSNRHGGPSS